MHAFRIAHSKHGQHGCVSRRAVRGRVGRRRQLEAGDEARADHRASIILDHQHRQGETRRTGRREMGTGTRVAQSFSSELSTVLCVDFFKLVTGTVSIAEFHLPLCCRVCCDCITHISGAPVARQGTNTIPRPHAQRQGVWHHARQRQGGNISDLPQQHGRRRNSRFDCQGITELLLLCICLSMCVFAAWL